MVGGKSFHQRKLWLRTGAVDAGHILQANGDIKDIASFILKKEKTVETEPDQNRKGKNKNRAYGRVHY